LGVESGLGTTMISCGRWANPCGGESAGSGGEQVEAKRQPVLLD